MIAGFYGRTYGNEAKIPLDSFSLWENRALAEINRLLARQLPEKLSDNAKMCICEVAEILYQDEKRSGIQSENIDGYSVRFNNGNEPEKILKIVKKWFSGDDILYRGDVL